MACLENNMMVISIESMNYLQENYEVERATNAFPASIITILIVSIKCKKQMVKGRCKFFLALCLSHFVNYMILVNSKMLGQYNPFKIVTKQAIVIRVPLHEKENLHFYHTQPKNPKQNKIISYVFGYQQKKHYLRLTYDYQIGFDVNSQVFKIWFLKEQTEKPSQIKFDKIASSKDSKYQMFYFNRTSQLCLIEINKQAKIIHTVFKFSLTQSQILTKMTSIESTLRQQQIVNFKLNNTGNIGWCSKQFTEKLSINIYQREVGFKEYHINLAELSHTFGQTTFTVIGMWQISDIVFVAINPNSNQQFICDSFYSPILKINLQGEKGQPYFSSCKFDAIYRTLLKKCINLEDFCVFLAETQINKQLISIIYVYEKGLQIIVKQEQHHQKHSLQNQIQEHIYLQNAYAIVHNNDNKQLVIIDKEIHRVSSLAFQKVLELVQCAETKQVSTAVIILGGDKTGKSTLRHFLSNKSLIHRHNAEGGFYEVVMETKQMQGMEHQEEKERIPWINFTQQAAIIDIPDWTHQDLSQFYKYQVYILLARLYRTFSAIHFIITIPFQYIDDSYRNQRFFNSVIQIINKEAQVEEFISIVLTKVDSEEESLQAFTQRIQEIIEINQETGNLIKRIRDQNRVMAFENRQFRQDEGKNMLSTILSFHKLSFKKSQSLQVETYLSKPTEVTDMILYESEFYWRMLNGYLLKIAHLLKGNLFPDIQYYLNFELLNNKDQRRQIQNKQEVALPYIVVLAKIKAIFLPQQKNILQKVSQLKQALFDFSKILENTNPQAFCNSLFFASIAAIKNSLLLPIYRTSSTKIEPFADFIQIIKKLPDFILGNHLQIIISQLQSFESVQNSPVLASFSTKSKGGQKMKKIIKVQMSYQQQKQQIRKRKQNFEELICSLPSNALKLDLILEELMELSKKKNRFEEYDYKLSNFYLREGSKICQYHRLYYEAMVLLLVIPDFFGLQMLIDDFIQFSKRNFSYENKKLLNERENNLVGTLLLVARECVRDNLVKKLINLRSLSAELVTKPANLRKEQINNLNNYLSNPEIIKEYKEKLEKKSVKFFYNFEDENFQKLTSEKGETIKKCLQFEESNLTKKKFEDREAFRYILDSIPIPPIPS